MLTCRVMLLIRLVRGRLFMRVVTLLWLWGRLLISRLLLVILIRGLRLLVWVGLVM